jgi:hypothetical protein
MYVLSDITKYDFNKSIYLSLSHNEQCASFSEENKDTKRQINELLRTRNVQVVYFTSVFALYFETSSNKSSGYLIHKMWRFRNQTTFQV